MKNGSEFQEAIKNDFSRLVWTEGLRVCTFFRSGKRTERIYTGASCNCDTENLDLPVDLPGLNNIKLAQSDKPNLELNQANKIQRKLKPFFRK